MSQPSVLETPTGDRGYHTKKAAYVLPNDSAEQHRLESQAAALRSLGGDKVIHAPLSAPSIRKALDVGCGTGVIAHELSATFPNAQVYGIDLTPVPVVREKLPNTEYIEGDVFTVADTEEPDPRFSPASFDYIFSRFLAMGMTDWKKYIETCVSLTAPGGWVEMHDLALYMRQLPENTPPANREAVLSTSPSLVDLQREPIPELYMWQKKFYGLMEAQGLDPLCGMHLPQLFAAAGLEDIHIRRMLFPFGNHDDLTDTEKQYLPQNKMVLSALVPAMTKKIQADLGNVNDADVAEIIRETREHLNTFDGRRDFAWVYIVWGRKPL